MSFPGATTESRPTVPHPASRRHRNCAAWLNPVDPAELPPPRVQELIDDLIVTMRAAGGAGLAATQIGEPVRICVIEVDDNPRYPYKPPIPLTVLVNPTVTRSQDERFVNNEGASRCRDCAATSSGSRRSGCNALDRSGSNVVMTVRGLSAGTYQHECDHLDGTLFVDKLADPTSLATWENFDRYRRDHYLVRVAELVGRYGQ